MNCQNRLSVRCVKYFQTRVMSYIRNTNICGISVVSCACVYKYMYICIPIGWLKHRCQEPAFRDDEPGGEARYIFICRGRGFPLFKYTHWYRPRCKRMPTTHRASRNPSSMGRHPAHRDSRAHVERARSIDVNHCQAPFPTMIHTSDR